MSPADALWTGPVPVIPASELAATTEADGVLLWVRDGVATVTVDGFGEVTAHAGEAIWIPPIARHSVRVQAGGVAVPLMVEAGSLPDALDRPAVIVVPERWSAWLVHRLATWFGFSGAARRDRSRLLDLLAGVERVDASGSDRPRLPRMPRSPGARLVIERMVRSPAGRDGLDDLAAAAAISPRTLQRQLLQETGHSLSHWRTAIRIDAAASHLSQGRSIDWTAHRVGYATTSGFAHAFAARTGVSPGRFMTERHDVSRSAEAWVDLLDAAVLPDPPEIAAVPAASWVTPLDSVLWVHRGTATIELGGRSRHLERGDVVWLPQGVAHLIEVHADSVVLPLGGKPGGRPVRAEQVPVVRMPQLESLERYLLHTVVANHFLLRPASHDDQGFLDLLHPSFAVPNSLPAHVERIVTAVVADPSDRRTLRDWSTELEVAVTPLRRDFRDAVGASLPEWRATVRMTEARALMWDGLAPSVVARRVGYAHLSGFSRAFATAHGVSPRESQRHEAR